MLRIFLILVIIPFSAFALTAEKRLEDPLQEKRAHELFKKIRCVVCSGESINDSKADIAKSLRVMVREKISQGASEDEIMADVTNSYGDSVLMKPPVNSKTAVLWFGPVIILIIGIFFFVMFFRQKLEK